VLLLLLLRGGGGRVDPAGHDSARHRAARCGLRVPHAECFARCARCALCVGALGKAPTLPPSQSLTWPPCLTPHPPTPLPLLIFNASVGVSVRLPPSRAQPVRGGSWAARGRPAAADRTIAGRYGTGPAAEGRCVAMREGPQCDGGTMDGNQGRH
jgi:hypothetical protein